MLAMERSGVGYILSPDRAEGMLDHLAPPVENFRSRFQLRRHAVEHRLVFQARDLAIVLGAARLDRANETRRPIAVIDLRQFPQRAFIARRQDLAGRTDEGVALRVVAELILAEKAIAHR